MQNIRINKRLLNSKLVAKKCICGHFNNVHQGGDGMCRVSMGISEKHPNGSMCACDIFIEEVDTSAKELERIIGL